MCERCAALAALRPEGRTRSHHGTARGVCRDGPGGLPPQVRRATRPPPTANHANDSHWSSGSTISFGASATELTRWGIADQFDS